MGPVCQISNKIGVTDKPMFITAKRCLPSASSVSCGRHNTSRRRSTLQPRTVGVTDTHSPKPRSAFHRSDASKVSNIQTALGGGDDGVSPPDLKGYGGGDNNEGKGDKESLALILAAGKSLESLPPDFLAALQAGKVPREIAERFIALSKGLLAPLLSYTGFRERLLADPSFFVKVGIEVGIGIFTKSTAEYAKRGKNFNNELDYVAANVMMALVADFMLVWLPAPTLSYAPRTTAKQNALQRFLASCPENAFQKVPLGQSPFTIEQRFGAVARNGFKLLLVGFSASMIGVSITNGLTALRQAFDPAFIPLNPPQNPAVMSAAYGSYMAISSNLRYQILAGVIEERGIEVAFKKYPLICNALSFVVRTGNTFLGSLMWVDYIRLLGLQKGH
eukprot:jgi/Botrbrau1/3608/Bobra.0204s0005.1